MMTFDAYVTAVLFERSGRAVFALGDGTVRFEDGAVCEAHPDGAVQCAALHPSGEGVITGGDDGRLVWSRAGEAPVELAEIKGRWIDAVAASAESGLIAFAAGREAQVLRAADDEVPARLRPRALGRRRRLRPQGPQARLRHLWRGRCSGSPASRARSRSC